jgi:NAD(P)-dependent dehydrogenase (short-subunit alcohol dehydrogenase family)
LATARALKAAGATVAVLDVALGRLAHDAMSEFDAAVECDVSSRISVESAAVVLESRVGPADLLVTSAGVAGAAATATFLCLPESRHITGQTLCVNGGAIML